MIIPSHLVAITLLAVSATLLAAPPDSSAYTKLLQARVDDDGMVDYKALKTNRAPLDTYAKALASVDPKDYETWSDEAQMALWINAYNAYTLISILDAYPIKPRFKTRFTYPHNSIRQIAGVWDKKTWPVAGKKVTLDAMEHEYLRKHWKEPRIHVAVVCASIGCPRLRNEAFTEKNLEAQLRDQARDFFSRAQNFGIDERKKQIQLSKIFEWFGEDFGKPATFIAPYVDEATIKKLNDPSYSITYLDWDWTLNEQ